jgi:glutamyl-tRNA synthetase
VVFEDQVYGKILEKVDLEVGDFVLKRRDGIYAYQLAVVADDLAMGITEVVRGRDLLNSTARQIQLAHALGGVPPTWAHLPLVLNPEGEKLSKRDDSLTLQSLREAGVGAEKVVGYLAFSLGLLDVPRPCVPRDLVDTFAWPRICRDDWTLPANFVTQLIRGTP